MVWNRIILTVEVLVLVGLTAATIWFWRDDTVVASTKNQPPTTITNQASNPRNTNAALEIAPIPTSWTLTAVGDIMLDRHVRTVIGKNGADFLFQNIRNELPSDIVLGNLEGPFTNRASVATDSHLVFTFDPSSASALASAGFTALSLANNHTLNFGQAGLDNTRSVLQQNHLDAFGDPRNQSGFGVEHAVSQKKVALIGYLGLSKGRDTILEDVREAKASGDYVVVMAHWGSEYNLGVTQRQRDDAHALIEAGADLILGAHPHVVEPVEIYQGKFIAYSLGNFIFDQYFSQDTLDGLLLRLTIVDDATTINFVPLHQVKNQPGPETTSRRQAMLDRLAKDSFVDQAQRAAIAAGHLVIPASP